MPSAEVIAIIGILAAAIPGVYAIWRTRKRTNAEAADIIQRAAGDMVDRADKQIKDANVRIDRLRSDLDVVQEENLGIRQSLVTTSEALEATREDLRITRELLLVTQEELKKTREALEKSESRLQEARDKLDKKDMS